MSKASIKAIGSYVPEKRLTNRDLEELVDTNDEWIVKRTGMRERRIADENEYTSDLSVKAVKNLIKRYDKQVEDVDMIICCTLTPDFKTPSTASLVQAKLGIKNAGAIDLNAACAGFTYGLYVANGLITSGLNKKILVIGAETLSKITDYSDRTTCVLFGDGAGAVLIEYDEKSPSFISAHAGSEGEMGDSLYCTDLSNNMFDEQLKDSGYIVQNGREVYKWAVNTVPEGINTLLEKSRIQLGDIDWFVPHSANLRIIESICDKSNIPIENTLYSLEYYGNTSSATIPLSLDMGVREGLLLPDQTVLLYGFGGGLAYAGQIIKWTV
ncbi:ketoacyl-ACP synthase III [Alkalihalobacillus sp. EGI L200015]|nr:ketoacyl-ACP synthase III [Pseudalkalibacillus salsuginis]